MATPTARPLMPSIALSSPPAKPSPWNRPKKNAVANRTQPRLRLGQRRFVTATNTMLPAIIGSTRCEGSRTRFSTDRVSVSVCASVKAVTTLIKSQNVTAPRTSAQMKSK